MRKWWKAFRAAIKAWWENLTKPKSSPEPVPPSDPIPVPVPIGDQRVSFLFDNAVGTYGRPMNITAVGTDSGWRKAIIDRQERNGDNCAWVYLHNSGDGHPVPTSIYSDRYGGTVDEEKLKQLRGIIKEYQRRGWPVVGWLTADDSRDLIRANREQHLSHVNTCVNRIGDLISEWCVGLEMDSDNRKKHAHAMISRGKELDNKRWGVLLNPGKWKPAVSWGADVLYYQFGFGKSPANCVAQAKDVIRKLAGRCAFVASEYHKSSDTRPAKAIGQALSGVEGVRGTGNGR